MNHMPDSVENIGPESKTYLNVDIEMEDSIIKVLRKI